MRSFSRVSVLFVLIAHVTHVAHVCVLPSGVVRSSIGVAYEEGKCFFRGKRQGLLAEFDSKPMVEPRKPLGDLVNRDKPKGDGDRLGVKMKMRASESSVGMGRGALDLGKENVDQPRWQ